MKSSNVLRIEPAENGWLVIEITFYDDDDDDDEPQAWSKDREGPHSDCNHSAEKVHVFVDHAKLMAFMSERTKPAKSGRS